MLGARCWPILRRVTARFSAGVVKLGYETIAGAHPVVPLMVRDTARTQALVQHLKGLYFPVVPRGAEEIRFQVSADHTEADIEEPLAAFTGFPERAN